MLAIIKKEIRSSMNSMSGCVFCAILLAMTGLYFTAYHLKGAYPKFSYTLQSVVIVFLIAVPILTMRSLAEERHQKTDQLLLTAPISVTRIVLGKYLALVGIFFIPVLVMGFYPLIMRMFGKVPMKESYTSLFGFFMMGCAFLAIGLFISALTESQVIAAVLTFLVLFLSYTMEGIAGFFPSTASASYISLAAVIAILCLLIWHWTQNTVIGAGLLIAGEAVLTILYKLRSAAFAGVIQKILGALHITGGFDNFSDGIFDVTGLVYFLSVILVCLFLTVQQIQKRRWS